MQKEITAPIAGRQTLPINLLPQWARIVKNPVIGVEPVEYDAERVNGYVNKRYKYIADNVDYWSNAKEFEENKGGDCEDFAIYKFCNLALPKYIAVGVLKEGNLTHAVCVAYSSAHQNWVVLDCMTDKVLTWQVYIEKFSPIYLCDKEGVYV